MKKIIYLALLALCTVGATAQTTDVRKKQFNLGDDGLAIDGYDPVAYFNSHKAVEGKKNISLVHEGVTYRFATEQNKAVFKANPAAYEPQYGGWCAYAMGNSGEKVPVDPETFKVLNGKLYLFYNRFFNNTLDKWNKDESNLKSKADRNWPAFITAKK
jgi:YHS domain-containing protein